MSDKEIKDLDLIQNEFELSFADLLPLQKSSGSAQSVGLGTLTKFIAGNSGVPSSVIANVAREIVSASRFSLFVDASNPNASDAKDNRGDSLGSPFRSVERALLEVARRSIIDGSSNDSTGKFGIFVYPSEYTINNGYGGGGTDIAFNRYQDAANLLFLNKDWIVQEAYDSAELVDQTPQLLAELRKFATAIVDDVANFSNINIVTSARTIKNISGVFGSYYQITENVAAIQGALTVAINRSVQAIKGLAPITIPGITSDPDSPENACQNVQATVNTLYGIIQATVSGSANPWAIATTRGSLRANFPSTGEPTDLNLQSFNSSYRSGVIVPRGVNLVFMSLRSTVLRPSYVPPKDGSEGRGAIFRLTGDSFITGGTIKDKIGLAESHHNLHAHEYCTLQDLQDYYDKVAFVFRDEALWNALQDGSNLLSRNFDWVISRTTTAEPIVLAEPENKGLFAATAPDLIQSIIKDLRSGGASNVSKFANDFLNSYISGIEVAQQALVIGFFESAFLALGANLAIAINNQAPERDGGYRDSRIASNPGVEARLNKLIETVNALISSEAPPDLNPDILSVGDTEVALGENQIVGSIINGVIQDTTQNSSAYVFSTTLRSDWGMCAGYIDGSAITGYKSFLAAQYTIVSYQNDPGAFVATVGQGDVANKRYRGTVPEDTADFRSFGFAFVNESYGQLVSCFNIGPAIHYFADDGSDVSIANSYSNMGDVSMLATGFRGQDGNEGAYPQDTGYIWTEIVRPKPIVRTGLAIANIPIGTVASSTATTVTLTAPIDFSLINPYTLKVGTNVYIDAGGGSEVFGVITVAVQEDSVEKTTISVSSFSGSVVASRQVYIKRISDIRSTEERLFRVRVIAPLLELDEDKENFIFRLNHAIHGRQLKGQNQTFYIADIKTVSGSTYDLVLLEAFKNPQGEQDTIEEAAIAADTDFEPTSLSIDDAGLNKPSYNAIKNLLLALSVPQPTIDLILVSGTDNYVLPSTYTVEFNKPSTIRGSHTWEFVGYYNPSTSFPQAQTFRLGQGLSGDAALRKRISKLFSQLKGGRVYATGIDEKGSVYIGQTRFNTRTGKQDNLRTLSVPGSSGTAGEQGAAGLQGATGAAGVSVIGASISGGNLILSLSNGGTINAGTLPSTTTRNQVVQLITLSSETDYSELPETEVLSGNSSFLADGESVLGLIYGRQTYSGGAEDNAYAYSVLRRQGSQYFLSLKVVVNAGLNTTGTKVAFILREDSIFSAFFP